MPLAIEQTIRHLAQSNNRAANRLLFAAIHSSHDGVRRLACRYLLATPLQARELVRGIGTYNEATLETLRSQQARLVPVLVTTITSTDPVLRRSALEAIHTLRLVEIIPDLITTIFQADSQKKTDDERRVERLIDTVVYLVGVLGEMGLDDAETKESLRKTVERAAGSLERVLRHSGSKSINLWMRLFILLFPFFAERNISICGIIDDASHPAYTTLFRFLLNGPVEVVNRFVIDRLREMTELPRTLVGVLSKRQDIAFLEPLFDFLAGTPSQTVDHHLQRVVSVSWLASINGIIKQFTPVQQCGLVRFIKTTSLLPDEFVAALKVIFENVESPTVRAHALAAIPLTAPQTIEPLILKGLESTDHEIQCAALRQADARKLPGAVATILTFADSPNISVRETVADLLPSIRFPRFLEVYDSIDTKLRKTFFKKICSIDQSVTLQIRAILAGNNAADQSKVVRCIIDGDLLGHLEDDIAQLALCGTTESLRIDAIRLLTLGQRTSTRNVLIQILHRDASEAIRLAAQAALERRPLPNTA